MPAVALTPENLRAFFDANPAKYKTPGSVDLQPDGYLSTGHLENLLVSPVDAVPNPAPATQVPQLITFAALAKAAPNTLSALSDADIAPLQAKLDARDNTGIGNWATLLNLRKIMPDSEKAAVLSLCAATMADPNWPATVPGPSDLQSQFGVSVLPPNTEVFEDYSPPLTHKRLASYQSFVDLAIGREGVKL